VIVLLLGTVAALPAYSAVETDRGSTAVTIDATHPAVDHDRRAQMTGPVAREQCYQAAGWNLLDMLECRHVTDAGVVTIVFDWITNGGPFAPLTVAA
jgi:hypothetical protein